MDVFAGFHGRVLAAVQQLKHDGVVPHEASVEGIALEPPKDHRTAISPPTPPWCWPSRRDFRRARLPSASCRCSRPIPNIDKVEIAGPGFINLTLSSALLADRAAHGAGAGRGYGKSAIGKGEVVNVEYVSANPTGPMHVGHCRGAVFGDALANLLAFTGFDVTREYYVNDAGAPGRCARPLCLSPLPRGARRGDRRDPRRALSRRLSEARRQALVDQHGNELLALPESEWLPIVRDAALRAMLAMIEDDLATLGIRHDVFFSERSLIDGPRDQVAETITDLEAKGLVYKGRLPPPKGKVDEDWEDREQLLFRSTEFGDDIDRPLVKSDGGYTYFASDIAYHRDKFGRGFKTMIDVWGADHSGHVRRMKAALAALTGGEAKLDIKLCQLVRLFRGGEPVKMSKRAGTFVTLRDVVDEVGPGPVRFMMLYRKNDAPLDFDFVKVTEQSRDNPVFYVQYAHARASSVLRNVRDVFPDLDLGGGALAPATWTG